MFRSKRDLDNYVNETLSKIPSEKEKVTRCLAFARAYYSLREFETARRYLEDYLQTDASNLFAAHKLMGDILVELNRHEEALEHYKRSYELSKSRDVLNKICSLLQNGYGQKETPQSRTNWLNLQKAASSLEFESPLNSPMGNNKYPYTPGNVSSPNPKLYTSFTSSSAPNSSSPKPPLTPRTISGGGLFSSISSIASPARNQNQKRLSFNPALKIPGEDIGENLTKLIESNKATIVHHTTLLQFYLTDRNLGDAVKHIHKFMLKYGSNFDFLEKSVQVMEEALEDQNQKSVQKELSEAELFSAYFFVLENYIGILLDLNLKDVVPEAVGEKRMALAAKYLHKLDQQLFLKGRRVKFSPLESWWPLFLKHCRAQLNFYMGILLQLRSQKDGKFQELFQSCFTFAAGFVIDQPLTMIKLRDPKLQQRAFIECCYRVIVTHKILRSSKAATFTNELKDLIFERCFPSLGSKNTSEFWSLPKLEGKREALPDGALTEEKFWLYMKVAQLLYPESLHHQIWLQSQAAERYPLDPPILHSVPFEEIPISTPTNRDSADSINQQDVDTFLTLSTLVILKEQSEFSKILPHLTSDLFSPTQLKFWSSAYKLTHGITNGSEWVQTENRLQVQRGLEMIRNLENTLPPSLMSLASNAFTKSALILEETNSAKQFLQLSTSLESLHQIYFNFAESYAKMYVESSLEPESKKQRIFLRFFDLRHFPNLPNPGLALERARYLLGWRAMENRDFENALTHFAETSFPESSLFSAEMYKILAEEELVLNPSEVTGKYRALLEQAKELLYETLSRRDKKSQEYLLGKSTTENLRAPLPHPKLENEGELLEMIDEVEGKLRETTLNVSLGSRGSPLDLGFSSILEDIERSELLAESLIEAPEEEDLRLRSPVVKSASQGRPRRSLREQVLISSTPRRLDEDFAMEEEVTFQAAVQFGDTVEKILEQNSVILDTISQMEDEIKDLNDRVEMLRRAKKFNRRGKGVSFSMGLLSG